MVRRKKKTSFRPDEPITNPDHHRPKTRRDFIAQGFMAGTATAVSMSPLASLFLSGKAKALNLTLDPSLEALCKVGLSGSGKIPFICFDLAGGANIAGSNVLVGGPGGQEDVLSTSGYTKLGISGDRLPNPGGDAASSFINEEFGLKFHSDSAMLQGMLDITSATSRAFVNGTVIAARSENDTGNNPHNPMYGIYRAGGEGSLLTLIGSSNSESGGNSMAPAALIEPSVRPTKIDRAADSTGLVDTGQLTSLLGKDRAVRVIEAMYGMSDAKLDRQLAGDASDATKDQIRCSYLKSADNVDQYGLPSELDPFQDPKINGDDGTPIFSAEEYSRSRNFEKTATIMKLVINGFAGAGTITMGGYDYHTGDRVTGDQRDDIAGRCIGGCIEYAHRVGKPVMIYVFSDGSVSSNGRPDMNHPMEKPEWTSDNQSTASSFFLVYNPTGRPLTQTQQIGYMSQDGSVVTSSSPAANNVNQLVNTVILNYMMLNGDISSGSYANFESLFTSIGSDHNLGNNLDSLIGVTLS